ncbi:HIRAN domain-containing protein [Roseovarius ramblicola]|uniref:HIRAN domain-containing protein n=1 Tax=Roseovarius ramblicola TaxID=2022336 RepID=A0ABV5I0W1_9RHOB
MAQLEKFVFSPNRPDGNWINWRIRSGWFEVAGVEHRLEDVLNFLRSAAEANDKGLSFGVALEAEPDNPHHTNAIKVLGFTECDNGQRSSYHIGYIPRETANQVAELYSDTPLAAELRQAKIGDFKIIVSVAGLIPKGTPK